MKLFQITPTDGILLSRWKSKDGTILISRTQHDFVGHTDEVTKEFVFVDGGIGPVIRRTPGLENLCLFDNENDHKELRELYTWTSYGIDGTSPPVTKPIKDLTEDHIKAIIKTQIHLPTQVLNMFKRELNFRKVNNAEQIHS